jgi:hypothetical protein
MKTVVAVHTAMPMVEPTKALFAKYLPDVRLINIVDDSLIQDVIQAFEVGMQNGGMASGLAMAVLKSPLAALTPAIHTPLMNVTGSMLATYWAGRPKKKIPKSKPSSKMIIPEV